MLGLPPDGKFDIALSFADCAHEFQFASVVAYLPSDTGMYTVDHAAHPQTSPAQGLLLVIDERPRVLPVVSAGLYRPNLLRLPAYPELQLLHDDHFHDVQMMSRPPRHLSTLRQHFRRPRGIVDIRYASYDGHASSKRSSTDTFNLRIAG